MEVEMKRKLISPAFFPNFGNQDEFFERITREEDAFRRILSLYLLLTVFSFGYGITMGSHHSFAQAFATGLKIPLLFSSTLLICFPAFLIIQFILGSKLMLTQMIAIILSGFVLTASVMIAFAPIIVFFQLTGGNYHFLILLHISVWALSGFFGMKTVVGALKYSCEKKNVYPHTGVVVFRFWVVILAFVGIQLGWNLRPFLGKREESFQLFREYEGNFYTAIIYSIRQLAGGDSENMNEQTGRDDQQTNESTPPFLLDKNGE
jgi:hypothetical protein